MIAELNKVYILSAPKECDGMTPGPDDFVHMTSDTMTFVKLKKIDSGKDVDGLAKVFSYKDLTLQAVIFVTDLPIKMAEQKLNNAVDRYLKNAKAAK
jgi:hypothetical protein